MINPDESVLEKILIRKIHILRVDEFGRRKFRRKGKTLLELHFYTILDPSDHFVGGERDEYTWGSCETNWKYDPGGTTERESSGVLELVRQVLCSFFPVKEYLSALRRSWDDGNCRDGDSCGWAMTTVSANRTLGS